MSQKHTYKIGIDARFFRKETGGFGRYTRELLHSLFRMDQHTEYFVFITPADLPEWDIDQPNVHPIVVPIVHYTSAEQTKFLAVLQKYRLDLVHFLNFNHPVLYPGKFVVTLHDLTLLSYPSKGKRMSAAKYAIFKLILKSAMRRAKKVIAISEFTAQDAEKRINLSHAKMEVVYEGGPDPVELLPGAKDAVRKYIGTSEPYFLFLSQWRPHKGMITILDAFADFKQKTGLPHKLVLVGKQSAIGDDVKDKLASHPFGSDIISPGFAPDELLPALYHYSTAFVMPSEYEGFGLPVLEAYAHGTAVICSDATSLPEVGGKGALYFPVRDYVGLASQMASVALDPSVRAKCIEQGYHHLRSFSWDKCAEQTYAVYLAVLEKHR